MSKIKWDEIDTRFFYKGVDRGVLYLDSGIAWTGLLSVNETPSGSDASANYMNGTKYFSGRGIENFEGSIEAYTYPLEFEPYNGLLNGVTNQKNKTFNFSYRTLIGDSNLGLDYGYLIHLIYNVSVVQNDVEHATVSDALNPFIFKWDFFTVASEFGNLTGSHLIVNSKVTNPEVLYKLENILYGTEDTDPRMPDAEELLELFESGSTLRITDHGDGTWTADGPDEAIIMLDSTLFQITWPSAIYLSSTTYKINSL